MPPTAAARQAVQFGIFELDPDAGELRKQGIKIKLQDQPFRVLEVLLERPGQIVTRDELRARVWPTGTFVEFDQGLYSAVARLRDALGDSPTSPRFVETVARRGYRFIAPVTESGGALPAAEPKWQPTAQKADRERRKFGVSAFVGLIGATALLVALLGFNIRGARDWLQRLGKSQIHSLAVLPFENLSGDADQEYFADGMTDELITSLGRLSGVRVVSRTSVMPYKKSGKPLFQIGRDLNVDAVIEGTVERSGDRVRIRVQLIHASRDQQLWAQSYDRQRRDTLLLESDVARDIAGQIQSAIEVPQRKPGNSQKVDSDAHEAYLRGLYASNKRSAAGFARAIEYFQEAIARDPNYAAAYSGLSDALCGEFYTGTAWDSVRERAKWAAVKAVEIDPSSAEAHEALGVVRELYDWDWSGAEREYQRAIGLNQNFAAAHQEYAVFLALQGRSDESVAEAQRSQELDPLSAFVRTTYCLDLYLSRRYGKAIEKCQQALELDPDFFHAHENLAIIYETAGKYDQAFQEYEKAQTIAGETPRNLAELKRAFQREGIRGLWHKRLGLVQRSATAASDPFEVALLYARLGDRNHAFVWLQRAYEGRSPQIELLKQASALDGLRSDPQFGELLRRTGLGPGP